MTTRKFRVWDNQEQRYFVPTHEAYNGNVIDVYVSMRGRLLMHVNGNMIDESIYPDRFVVEWHTSLKDVHGNAIVEGDIVQTRNCASAIHKIYKGAVTFIRGAWCIRDCDNISTPQLRAWTIQDIEVLGNIHEHAHLLEATP